MHCDVGELTESMENELCSHTHTHTEARYISMCSLPGDISEEPVT